MAAPESESKELIDAGEIEKRLAGYRKIMGRETSLMTRAVHTARAMQIARKYVEQNVRYLVDLQGSELGFLTDKKDGEKYTAAELVDPLTSALVLGVPLVGGCAMVLAKRLYITSPGWEHRFRETEDMSWPEIRIGEIEHIDEPRYVDLPKEKQYVHRGQLVKDRSVPGTARVECWARVVYGKIEHQVTFFDRRSTEGGMDERLIIKVNRGMTDDAVIGKARARLYKALWRQAMGVGLTLQTTRDRRTTAARWRPSDRCRLASSLSQTLRSQLPVSRRTRRQVPRNRQSQRIIPFRSLARSLSLRHAFSTARRSRS